ncbi:uncharacterized protein LOC122261280 [Penaeus japonicus]|uniref:uncharacterized protein LOC122261280 n=1 Tax=Penaeus japonicus TaxID=27405 RepID=UPI001C711B71|nr:uncharacterized protein LOC122261280 [Penaeus japonicus]
MLDVVSVYVPKVGCGEKEKDQFWQDLDNIYMNIPVEEKVYLAGDSNGHIGVVNDAFIMSLEVATLTLMENGNEEFVQKLLDETELKDDVEDCWNIINAKIVRIWEEAFDKTTGKGSEENKETSEWNEDVKEKIKEKKLAKKEYYR